MCYRLIDKVFGATPESVADKPAAGRRVDKAPPARVEAGARDLAEGIAFTGFLARLQRGPSRPDPIREESLS